MLSEKSPSFEYEKKFEGIVAGIDEAGCGAWAGPVVAGAAAFRERPKDELLELLDDSKKLSEQKRNEAFLFLKREKIAVAFGVASPEEIDQLNVRKATHLAMIRALESLPLQPTGILVDGNIRPPFKIPTEVIIKGDQKSYSIAAASIVAKVMRDDMMRKISREYPLFCWDKNVGYGTKAHQEAIKVYGPTPYHRKSFAPIKEALEQLSLF